jgi:WD40 repeat protein
MSMRTTRFISLPALLCILALCSGCLVTQTVANESAPTMRSLPVEVPELEPNYILSQLQFSPDGKRFLEARHSTFANLYSTETGKLLWSFDERSHDILGLGFIDAHQHYIGTMGDEHSEAGERRIARKVRVQQLGLSAPSTTYEFPDGRNKKMLVRGDYVYYDAQLLDRRDGRIQRVITAHPYGPPAHLMADGKVLTQAYGDAVLYDATSESYLHWRTEDGPVGVSASERFVITLASNGRCSVWRLPSTERVENCSFPSLFRDEEFLRVRVHPTRERFAITWGNKLRVYDLEPFRLVLQRDLEHTATGLTFSQGNLLAAALRGGRILVWNLEEARLVGQYDFNYDRLLIRNDLLQFSPDGRLLLTGAHAPVLLEVP